MYQGILEKEKYLYEVSKLMTVIKWNGKTGVKIISCLLFRLNPGARGEHLALMSN